MLLVAAAVAALAGAAGCEETTTPTEPTTAADPAETARIQTSRKRIDDASLAIDEKRYAEARKLLDEAKKMAVESHRFEVSELLEKLDKREAKLWANEVSERLDQKECADAFKELAAQMEALQSEVFTHEVRKLVSKQAVGCVSSKIDEATTAGKFAEARAIVDADTTKAALGDAAWKKLSAELGETITEAIAGQLADDLKAKRWGQAVDRLEAAVKKGDATEAQARAILGRIRGAAAPELTAEAAKAIGTKDAAAALKQVDGVIAKLGWQAMAPDAAALAQDKALPEALGQKREALAAWVETQRVKMKPLKKVEKRWTHGKVAVLPAASTEGASKRDLKPSTEVWVLGQTKELALVTEVDPGNATLAAALDKVLGWVPVKRLAAESTADWIPPDDQLKGERVWGPLRDKQPTLELGVVEGVVGGEITVKRLADDALIKVTRGQLRNGRLAQGTKVLAFCKAEGDVATIFEMLPGARVARIQCEGGMQKEESLASLRTKPELLPPSK
jgi:hypothetical protein